LQRCCRLRHVFFLYINPARDAGFDST
jgi:hypothetical protein